MAPAHHELPALLWPHAAFAELHPGDHPRVRLPIQTRPRRRGVGKCRPVRREQKKFGKVPTMNRSRLALASAALFTTLAILGASPAPAQQGNEMTLPVNAGLVSTSATAHRRIPNTVADVSVGIQTQGVDASSVSKDLAQRSPTLLDRSEEHTS